jgi:hypothetical protein
MDASAWFGLALGTALGGGYALWQGWAIRHESQAAPSSHFLAGAMLRLVLLVVTLLLAVRVTSANRWWLTGSLAVSYSVPFFWQLRRIFLQKK